MIFKDLKKKSTFYRPLIWSDRILKYEYRKVLINFLSAILAILSATYLLFFWGTEGKILGSILLVFTFWAPLVSWEMFCNYLRNKDPHLTGVTPLVAQIVNNSSKRDLTGAFIKSSVGKLVLKRFSIDWTEFFEDRDRPKINFSNFEIENSVFIDLPRYLETLLEKDLYLKEFLFQRAVGEEQVINLAEWIEREFYLWTRANRWWTRDSLLRVPGIGVAFSYGRAHLLEQYSKRVEGSDSDILSDYFEEDIERVEDVLIRSREANALVVGSRENLHMIPLLQRKIESGDVHPNLEYKDLFVLDTEELIANTKNKATFEQSFFRILQEIEHAGNIILVLEDLPNFVTSAQSIGAGIVPMIEQYLSSNKVQIVAFSNEEKYQSILEPNEIVRERFEEVLVDDKENEVIRSVVENYISLIEDGLDIFFEYKAIDAIVKGIERYFLRSSPIDEVSDTLIDLTEKISGLGKDIILEKDVLKLFEEKTGIPMREVDSRERQKLIHLEEILHRRVIGQNSAIASVADSLRRVRSGISNPDRPMGTFLFLGPTGVGKTETAKALSESFFGSEQNIKRLDMSEFSSDDAVSRLIGSFETGKLGVLSSMLREEPYGVLLLDEFEKASKDVQDLFLRILDEGVFSDMRGDKVNARNLLIIATSNAGSDMIWQYAKRGEDISKYEKEVVNSIVESRVFKPELLNRFDSVVVFHPLDKDHVLKIAHLMMAKLSERLRVKGIKVSLAEDAFEEIVEAGISSEFGARELNRVLQDKVESAIARMMLEGKLQRGDSVTLRSADFNT